MLWTDGTGNSVPATDYPEGGADGVYANALQKSRLRRLRFDTGTDSVLATDESE
jgi:hypothetical protein